MGGTAARAHPSSYLRTGWTDCAEIWYAVRDTLAERLQTDPLGKHLKRQCWSTRTRATCAPPFRISGTAGRIRLQIGGWLLVKGPLAIHFTQNGGHLPELTCYYKIDGRNVTESLATIHF